MISSNSNYLPKVPVPNTFTLRVGFNTWILRRHKHTIYNKVRSPLSQFLHLETHWAGPCAVHLVATSHLCQCS